MRRVDMLVWQILHAGQHETRTHKEACLLEIE